MSEVTTVRFFRFNVNILGTGEHLWGLDVTSSQQGLYYKGPTDTNYSRVLNRTFSNYQIQDFGLANNVAYVTLTQNNQMNALLWQVNVAGGNVTITPFGGTSFASTALNQQPSSNLGILQGPGGLSFDVINSIDVLTGKTSAALIVVNGLLSGSTQFQAYTGTFTTGLTTATMMLNSIDVVRFVPNPALSDADQLKNFNQLTTTNSTISQEIYCNGCVGYTGQSSTTGNLPIGSQSLNIYPQVAVSLSTTGGAQMNNTYFLAKDIQDTSNNLNLYIAPGIVTGGQTIGPFSVLPGYYNTDNAIAVAGNNLYITGRKFTCS
jgi:hypothetical protein